MKKSYYHHLKQKKVDNWWVALCLFAIVGNLYFLAMLVYFAVTDMFSFNFWHTLFATLGWSLFVALMNDVNSQFTGGKS